MFPRTYASGAEDTICSMPLTNVERDIAKKVVTRFIRLKESTPYKGLVREFKDPSVFERLTSSNILRGLGVNRSRSLLTHCVNISLFERRGCVEVGKDQCHDDSACSP